MLEKSHRSFDRAPARLRVLETATREVLSEVFGTGKPADRAVANFFHNNRQCGSRDRLVIAQGVYALLRYWGWLRRFLPDDRRVEIESGVIRITGDELRALLWAGMLCDHSEPDIADALRNELHISKLTGDLGNPLSRAKVAAGVFGAGVSLTLADLVPEWVKDHVPEDFDFANFTKLLSKRPPLWLRAQGDADTVAAELTAAGLSVSPGPLPASFAVRGDRMNLFKLPGYVEGRFEVQDLSSQAIGTVAAPKPGERWFDPCAGAGGKSLQLAALMKNRGTVVAGDVRDYILDELRKRARRSGFSNISTHVHDGRPWRGLKPFDGVLVDAPCSCSGVWRRHPGSQWKMKPDELEEFSQRQFDILSHFAPTVKPGGMLVYGTCSIFTAENEDVITRFLAKYPQFKLDPFPHPFTGAGQTTPPVAPGMARLNSNACDSDSMFVCRMRHFE